MNKKITLELNTMSKAKLFFLGLATVFVMFYHSKINFSTENCINRIWELINLFLFNIKINCEMGVEIFLFFSSIGLFFSLKKNNDILSFYKRRISRILFELLLVSFIWEVIFLKGTFFDYIYQLSGLKFLLEGNRWIWYFVLIFYLYLFFPIFFKLNIKYGKNINLVFVVVSLIINVVVSILIPNIYQNIEIALRRLPIFFIGLYFAKDVYENRKMNINIYLLVILYLIMFLILMIGEVEFNRIWNNVSRYLLGLQAINLIFIISCIFQKIEKYLTVITKIGSYSLEVYLIFERIIVILYKQNLQLNELTIAIIGTLITIPLAYLLSSSNKKVMQIVKI